MAITSPLDFLFVAEPGTDGTMTRLGANRATVARASVGEHRRVDRMVDTAFPAGKPRHKWVKNPATGLYDQRALVLEPARTNIFPDGHLASQWSTQNSNTVSNVNAPLDPQGNSGQVIKVTEVATSAPQHVVRYFSGLTADTEYTVSGYLIKGNTRYAKMGFSWSAVVGVWVDFDGETWGSYGDASTDPVLKRVYAEKISDEIWWVSATAVRPASATDTYLSVGPANAEITSGTNGYTGDASKYMCFWQTQFEQAKFATSMIPNGTTTTTRSADSFIYPTAPDPQELAVYFRFTDMGGASLQQDYILGIGGGSTDPRIVFYMGSIGFWVHYRNDAAAGPTVGEMPKPTFGQDVELLYTLSASEARLFGVYDGVDQSSYSGAHTAAFPAKWHSNTIAVGGNEAGGRISSIAPRSIRIAKLSAFSGMTDQAIMDDLRNTTLDFGGNLLRRAA